VTGIASMWVRQPWWGQDEAIDAQVPSSAWQLERIID